VNYGISAMKLPNRPDHHKLAFTLAAHFPDYRKNQLELLMLMVFALIQAQTVRHAKLAERFPGTANFESVIRRIERFLILTMHLAGRIASSTASRSVKQTSCRWFLPVCQPNRN
jgi:hypothetical protein